MNRIPSVTEDKDGYMCVDCQSVECDRCGEPTLEYESEGIPEGMPFDFVCPDCLAAINPDYEP